VNSNDDSGMLLGRNIPASEHYAPGLLFPIPREEGRKSLDLPSVMYGCDQWHAYELSWLDDSGKPLARVGRFTFPAGSPCMIESKSFKLYLNSLNNHVFASEEQFVQQVTEDLGRVAHAQVELQLFTLEAQELAGATDLGACLDECDPGPRQSEPTGSTLQIAGDERVEEMVYSNLLRSLCPVTAQPDWATVRIYYRGPAISHASLLAYILAFRNHQEFHEHCIERMFSDLMLACKPELLEIQGFYTRRGGLDINPFRSTDPSGKPLPRLNRQ
jgi:7-cyano-7-deazaguanine reductase